jgi:hypothetical protein
MPVLPGPVDGTLLVVKKVLFLQFANSNDRGGFESDLNWNTGG